jgi:hypothetical protein
MVNETGQPYAYTGDDPVNERDPNGRATLGLCGSLNGMAGVINGGAGGCLTRTIDSSGEDDIGLVGTLSGGAGVGVDGGAAVSVQVSNATSLSQLKGWFDYVTVAGQDIAGAQVTVFWNSQLTVYGVEIGGSIGAGASVSAGWSDTWVDQLNGVISANAARAVWDLMDPQALNLSSLLSLAQSLISKYGCSVQ